MTTNEDGAAMLARIRQTMGPEALEMMLKTAESATPELKEWPPERIFQYIRCRLRFTQSELAQKAGLTQSQISRVESGADCLFSTWARAYAAMGFELRLLPSSKASIAELEKRAEAGRPEGHCLRQRARPRRLWRNGIMLSRAELNASRDTDN